MESFLNSHGLEHGYIPAGKECPFLLLCKLRVDTCPSKELGNRRLGVFSCAAARFFSMDLCRKEEKNAG